MSQGVSRLRPKRVHVFAAQATALALLLGFLPGMDRVYPALFNAHAQVVFNGVLAVVAPGHHLRIATIETDDADRRDTRMVGFGPGRAEREWRQFYRVFPMGWWPSAFVIGMVLATPLPWRRRGLALLGALAIADALLLIRIGVMIFLNYSITESVDPEGWLRARGVAEESFRSWVPGLVTVLVSWVSVARPASSIDLTSARRRLGGSRSAAPREKLGEGPARRVAEEGKHDGERAGDADQ